MPDVDRSARRRASMPFILVVVFIDVLGIGIALPVLPGLRARDEALAAHGSQPLGDLTQALDHSKR